MTSTAFTPTDIVNFAAQRDAANIATAFDQLVGQRIGAAIQAKKQEIAQAMFAEPVEQETDIASTEDDAAEVVDQDQEEQQDGVDQSQEESEESNENAEEHN